MSEAYLLYYQAVLPIFTNLNKLLQRQDPCFHILLDEMRRFVVNVLKKFVKPEIIREAEDVTESSVMASQNQLSDEDVFIGYATKQLMKKLEREGDLSPHQRRTFFIVCSRVLWRYI